MIDTKFLEKLSDIVEKYLNGVDEGRVSEYLKPEDLKDELSVYIEDKGIDEETLFNLIETYLRYSVKTGGYRFSNQLYTGLNPAAFAGEVITAITNTSMATYEIAPAATVMEQELVQEFIRLTGFSRKTADGIMVTGGSNANMIAMMCGRQKLDKNIKKNGIVEGGLKGFVSEQSHYSFSKAAAVLGIGTDNLVSVKSNDKGQMLPASLEEEINKSISMGEKPFFVGATAGTTVLGAFDQLEEIGNIAKKYNLWLHVDGAWGGAVLLSSKYRYLLKGLEKANSFSIDAHKLMGVPLIASFIIVDDGAVLRDTNSGGGGEYIFHDYDYEYMDTGKKSIQCGRRVDCLKVWLTWKLLGRNGYEEQINRIFLNRDYAVKLINSSEVFKLYHEPEFLNICFGYKSENSDVDKNRLILETRKRVVTEGKYLVNYSLLKRGDVCFRMIISNPSYTKERLEEFFKYMETTLLKVEQDLVSEG